MHYICIKSDSRKYKGFSLAEMIATLVIGSMVLVATLTIYSRARSGAQSIRDKIARERKPTEILQKIAEDLDSIISGDRNVRVTVENGFDSAGYPSARLTIRRNIYGKDDDKKLLERIIWVSAYDFSSTKEGQVLFRSQTGLVSEDKLFEQWRADWEGQYSYMPVCQGVTFFRVQVIEGEEFLDQWNRNQLPPALKITISFAQPYENMTGEMDVEQSEKFTRIIALDRTRKINFKLPENQQQSDDNQNQNQSNAGSRQ